MPKNLSDILKGVKKSTTTALTTGDVPAVDYADKMKDTRDFVAQHSVEKHEDRVGNDDDVYKGSTKNKIDSRHGNVPMPKDIKVYNKANQVKEGKMCESCGKSPCECDHDDEPKDNGKKDKPGKRKLLTDKKLQEMSTSQNQAIAARIALSHKEKGTMPPAGTASRSMMSMSAKQLKDYTHAKKGAPKKVDEAVYNHSSSETASEKARKELVKDMKEKKKEKEKMKEESAPADTPITLPVTNSREGFKL